MVCKAGRGCGGGDRGSSARILADHVAEGNANTSTFHTGTWARSYAGLVLEVTASEFMLAMPL